MIEINLLPVELRGKVEKVSGGLNLNQFLFLLPLFAGLLIIFHIILFGVFIINNLQLGSLSRKWEGFGPERKKADIFQQENKATSLNAKVTQKFLSKRIGWSEKLNKLSAYLPNGVWFNELSLNPEDLTLKGSIVSLQKDEMNLINKFLFKLKSDERFYKDFSSLELNSVQKRVVGSYDVVEFILFGVLKTAPLKKGDAKASPSKNEDKKTK